MRLIATLWRWLLTGWLGFRRWWSGRLRRRHPHFRSRAGHFALRHGLRRHDRDRLGLDGSLHAWHLARTFARHFPTLLAFLHREGGLGAFFPAHLGRRHVAAERGRRSLGFLRTRHLARGGDLWGTDAGRRLSRAFHALHLAHFAALFAVLRGECGLGPIVPAYVGGRYFAAHRGARCRCVWRTRRVARPEARRHI
jgi:hypothetical protein